ncbi:MAG: DUF47 family protein [Chloroflexi bacterium]|nr:DUF47 family protein [Chloroflexota bacterium]
MSPWFRRRRPNPFLARLLRQAELTVQGFELLDRYMQQPNPESARQLKLIEEEADEVRRLLIDELNRSFVTPFDREDIFALSLAIDDMLDYAYTTVDEMEIFQVEPTPAMRRMVDLLRSAATEIWRGVQRLDGHPRVANEHAVRAKALENQVEKEYRKALAEIFESVQTVEDVVRILKYREIYRHLSNAADRGDQAANVIGDIVVKWI